MICTLCESLAPKFVLPPYVCSACEADLSLCAINQTEMFGFNPAHIVFEYAGPIREFVMRAKVKNDPVAVGFLRRALSHHAAPIINSFDHSESLIIPAPASAWGRVRGRFDLAQLMASCLFTQADVFRGIFPGALFRRKRAGRNQDQSIDFILPLKLLSDFITSNAKTDLSGRISRSKKILVVDDVMTTGFTMRTIFNQLIELGAQTVEALVIASSSYSDGEGINDIP